MMKKRIDNFFKTKTKVNGRKKNRFNVANIVTLLAVFLCISLLIIFLQSLQVQSLQGKQSALVQTYNTLSQSFSGLLSQVNSMKDENSDLDRKNLSLLEQVTLYEQDAIEYQLKIDECNSKIAELTKQIEDLNASAEANTALVAEYEEQIAKYQEAAEALADPLGLSSTPLTSESYLYKGTKWNLIENYTVKKSGSTYTTGQFLVSPSYYYAVYASGNVSITCYTKEYSTIKTLKEDASDGWFVTFDKDVAYVSLKYTDENALFVSTGINVSNPETPTKGRAFYVVSKNSPVKLSVSKAVSMVTGNGTVLVLPGTYQDNVSAISKKINLIGANKSSCILESSDMDYANPPLEIAAGSVKNMTIRTVNKGSKDADKKAYAIHSDYDYQAGRGLTISNCIISSDFNAGIGLGTRKGTVTISNCTITGKDHGIFFHNADRADVGGEQTLKITGCTIKGTTGNYAIAIQGIALDNTKMSLIFKNNKFSNGNGGSPAINTVAGAGEDDSSWLGFKGFTLDSSSTGNNIAAFNSK